ncbi:MAG: hypothetical protein RQ754_03500 [Desulfuromonadales bacterium]|nr:hypothetical protein [Desulfuromonadales bacterium]
MRQIFVFTDLDGTLLDHHEYSFAAAQPAFDQIGRGIGGDFRRGNP